MDILKIRASSFASLVDCPARWKATHLEGKRLPNSYPAHLGTSIHHATAVFDQAVLDGSPVTAMDAASAFVDALRNPENEVVRSADDLKPVEAERIGIELTTRYCREIAPARKYVAVEAACEPLRIDCGNGVAIELTGTLDRLREEPGRVLDQYGNVLYDTVLGISDVKSGARRIVRGEVSTAADGAQIGVYELIAEKKVGRAITADGEIIAMQTKNGGEVKTATLRNTKSILIGTPERPGLLLYAATLYERDLWIGNPKSGLCSERYCPEFKHCPYRG